MGTSILRILFLVGFCLGVMACEGRRPSVGTLELASRSPQNSDDLISGSQRVLEDLRDPKMFNARTCAPYIGAITERLAALPSKHFAPASAQEARRLKKEGPTVLRTLFAARLVLRERLREFTLSGALDPACVDLSRRGFRYLRFTEETLMEWLQTNEVFLPSKPPILAGDAPHTMINPKFSDARIRAGDIFMVRGKSYISAMIARIGDEEAQFSHAAIVGQDPKGGLHVVEALIQYGTIVTPLAEWLKQEDSRVVLFRQPDAEMATAAARAIYDRAEPFYRRGKNIRYDFAMDDRDSSTLFCAEVLGIAYSDASGGKFLMPLHRTQSTKFRGTGFLESLGIGQDSFFAPGDLEVDTRFELVAEYRHWPLLRRVRMQDSVLSSLYSWMIERDYRFRWNDNINVKTYLGKVLRQAGFLSNTLPTYMPMDAIRTSLQFEAAAGALEDHLFEREDRFFEKNGYSYSFREMLAINEEFRKKDCEIHRRAQRSNRGPVIGDYSRFSSFFSPKNGCR